MASPRSLLRHRVDSAASALLAQAVPVLVLLVQPPEDNSIIYLNNSRPLISRNGRGMGGHFYER